MGSSVDGEAPLPDPRPRTSENSCTKSNGGPMLHPLLPAPPPLLLLPLAAVGVTGASPGGPAGDLAEKLPGKLLGSQETSMLQLRPRAAS